MPRKALIEFRRDTAANWTAANPTLAAGEPGFETNTGKVKIGDGATAWNSLGYIGPTTSPVSSVFGRTGAVVAGNADYLAVATGGLTGATAATRYVGGTASGHPSSGTFAVGDFVVDQTGSIWVCTTAGTPGTWAQLSSGTASPLTTKGDLFGYSTTNARIPIGSDTQVLTADSTQTLGLKWAAAPSAGIGSSVLIYRYTVTGSVKASIDTGVDSPNAGSNDWTNGDLLEVFLYARTDEVVALSQVNITLNNDTGGHYDLVFTATSNATVTGSNTLGAAQWAANVAGASAAASVFDTVNLVIPNYAGTVGNKQGQMAAGNADQTAANMRNVWFAIGYRSTSAITRLKVIPNTAAKNLAIGTQLLIYKRTAS